MARDDSRFFRAGKILLCSLLLECFVCSAPVKAQQGWKEFRGPNGSGLALKAMPPVDWHETEPDENEPGENRNIVWKRSIHDRGWSSPVISEKRIWLTTASEDGKKMYVVCLDTESGKIIHDRLLFTNENPREIDVTNSYASPTAVIDGNRVYVHFGTYGTACLDASSAKILWQRRDFPCNHWRGAGSSPIVYKNMMIVHYDGYDFQYIVALDKMTGKTIWKKDRLDLYETDNGDHKKAFGTPAVFNIEGEPLLISPFAKATIAYEPQNGKERWWIQFKQHSMANRPLYDGKHVFIGTGFGKGELIAVDPSGAKGNVTETHISWIVKRAMPSKPSPLLVQGRIYTVADKNGIVSCIDASTGEIIWQDRIGGTFSASPVFAGGHIYFCDEKGKTTVVKPADELTVVAENKLNDGCMATPAPLGQAIFIRTRTAMYRIEKRNQ